MLLSSWTYSVHRFEVDVVRARKPVRILYDIFHMYAAVARFNSRNRKL